MPFERLLRSRSYIVPLIQVHVLVHTHTDVNLRVYFDIPYTVLEVEGVEGVDKTPVVDWQTSGCHCNIRGRHPMPTPPHQIWALLTCQFIRIRH